MNHTFVYIHYTHFSDDTIVDTETNVSKRNELDFSYHHPVSLNFVNILILQL